MRKSKVCLFTLVLILISSALAVADVPQLISYQGRLTDNLDNPLNGVYSITFSIYTDSVAGTQVWTETKSVTVTDGNFSIYLGTDSVITESVFSDAARYLGIKVGADPEMERSLIATSPYAYRVATVDGSVSTSLVLDDNVNSRVELSVGNDVLRVYDQNGWLRIRMTMDSASAFARSGSGTDGGGAISFYPSGFLARSQVDNQSELNQNNGSLVSIGESSLGTGEISTFDQNGNELTRVTSTSIDGGAYYSYLDDGTLLTVQGQATDTGGYIGTFGTNGNRATALSSLTGNPGNGFISVSDSTGGTRGGLYADFGMDGHFYTNNRNGLTTVEMSNTGDAVTPGGGFIFVNGTNGLRNVSLWHLNSFDNNGYIEVHDSDGVSQAGIYVDASGNGIVFGDQKSFAMDNPNQPGTELWYTSLEGPEAAAYIRGTQSLVNGSAVVYFPEHYVTVANPNGMTVQVVPLSADSKGLAVVEKYADRIVVKELYNGTGTYDFDYTITSVRKGFEDYKVVHDAKERIPIEKAPKDLDKAQSTIRKINRAGLKDGLN